MANTNGTNGRPPLKLDEVRGAVDLNNVGCHGCKFLRKQSCQRFPLVWTTPQPNPDNPEEFTAGGWAFPPAIRKCGEFAKP